MWRGYCGLARKFSTTRLFEASKCSKSVENMKIIRHTPYTSLPREREVRNRDFRGIQYRWIKILKKIRLMKGKQDQDRKLLAGAGPPRRIAARHGTEDENDRFAPVACRYSHERDYVKRKSSLFSYHYIGENTRNHRYHPIFPYDYTTIVTHSE